MSSRARKAESQDVCFITEAAGRERFLAERIDLHPAELVDAAGQRVGAARAVELVTVGQRKGLDLEGAPLHLRMVLLEVLGIGLCDRVRGAHGA